MGTSAAVADRRPVWAVCAEQLIDAAATSTPCAPLRDLLPEGTLEDGYGVQRLVHEETGRGRRRVGRKIGLTSAAVQQQMGVDCPDFGVLFADMAFGDAEPIPYDTLMQPRIEAEVAFVLGADLSDRPITAVDVLRATEFVVPAIEVCASRIAEWDITIFDTVADNASAGVYVTGSAPRLLRDLDDLKDMAMTLTSAGERLSEGRGSACLGHPVNAVVWLANQVASRGEPLLAGETVLSGSLGPLVPARRDTEYHASISGLGSVTASFV
ncbi:2-keto-4-pentenoate hydratase [Candidatus Poriferisocius sp.]|uniref:2-keto-4-pentenoate hydratase n=1 Tax=Candidatus Poriferisocius sp. TaxID=3101276 RepID=UPI003B5BAD95